MTPDERYRGNANGRDDTGRAGAMAQVNTLRMILVGGAVFGALAAALLGAWLAAGLLTIGVAAHGLMWWHLHRHPPPGSGVPRPGVPRTPL